MLKKEIIESNIKEEVANGTMEILEQNLHSILVWDDKNNKEIKFSFSEFLNEKTVRDAIYISDTIPKKWKIDADELAKYLWRVCDRNSFITLSRIIVFWDPWIVDDEEDNSDPYRQKLEDETGDDYANYLAEAPLLGQLWFERNIVAINAASIMVASKEVEKENLNWGDPWFSVENQYHIGVLQTAIHELRHLQMDTNPFLQKILIPLKDLRRTLSKRTAEMCLRVMQFWRISFLVCSRRIDLIPHYITIPTDWDGKTICLAVPVSLSELAKFFQE